MNERQRAQGPLAIASIASAGAAVMHAAAAGIHADHATLSRTFVALTVAQATVAVVGFLRSGRAAIAALVGVNLFAVGGWLVTRFAGLSWFPGLEVAESPQLADSVTAILALVAVVAAASALGPEAPAIPARSVVSSAVLVGVLMAPGLLAATDHDHDGHDTADHGTAAGAPDEATNGHAHAVVTDDHDDHADDADHADHDTPSSTVPNNTTEATAPTPPTPPPAAAPPTTAATTAATSAATQPYDPTLPIDLGGLDGVTPQQQAFAENLVAATVRDLPQWADLDVVAAAGFHSIGDGLTGHEHYIQWDWIDDDIILDPDYPESLVFEPQPDGSKRLVSAMFMLPRDVDAADVPDYGGALMQWHVHGDLCFTDDPVVPQVAGVKPVGTPCRPPTVDGTLAPMIHVWITPTPCGPFAALDGIAAGQVAPGEEELCDTAHGSH